MMSSEIYSHFYADIIWIKDVIQQDIFDVPDSVKDLANYYIKERLIIITEKEQRVIKDPFLGRPVPYATFWFADAFKPIDDLITRRLALAMVYSSIVTTLRDDLVDDRPTERSRYHVLIDSFQNKYLEIFRELFGPDSIFWFYLKRSEKEISRYENWRTLSTPSEKFAPFSEDFLAESSRYFSAVVLPSLAALAIITDNEEKIQQIDEFLRNFSMGWRIYDDLKDWPADLKKKNLNHSSILIYAQQKVGRGKKLTEETVQSMFLEPGLIEEAYDAILGFFRAAKKDVSDLKTRYLSRFMDEQINYHNRWKNHLIQSRSDFFNQLHKLLNKH